MQDPARAHGLDRILDKVVEGLLKLVTVHLRFGQVRCKFHFHQDVAVLNLGTNKGDRFLDDFIDIGGNELGSGRPDGAQELLDDGIKPLDFALGDVKQFLDAAAHLFGHTAQLPVNQLQVNIQRVVGVPDLVGNACRQQGQGR